MFKEEAVKSCILTNLAMTSATGTAVIHAYRIETRISFRAADNIFSPCGENQFTITPDAAAIK